MMDGFAGYERRGWDRRQFAASGVAVFVACVLCGVFLQAYLVRAASDCDVVVRERINPNTASAASLVRLANIGPKRAQAIIEYRQSVPEGEVAFGRCDDLEKIKGIGPKTVEGMRDEICFD